MVRGGDCPIVGPQTAKVLREFSKEPEPDLPEKHHVENMIGKLSIATAKSKVSDEEAREALDLYWMALNDIPLVDLRLGFKKLIQTATFLPKPAEIRRACGIYGAQRRHMKSRAHYLAWKHDMEWTEPVTEFISAKELKGLLG